MGSLLGFIVLFIRHRRRGDGITKEQLRTSHPSHTMHYTVVRLIKIAIPIGIGSLLVNVANLVDTTFLQTRIGDIMESSQDVLLSMYNGLIPEYNLKNPDSIPNFLYGCYANAMTLYMLVPSITQAFGISALPNVTSAWTRGDRREIKKSIETVMRVTALVAIPGRAWHERAGPAHRQPDLRQPRCIPDYCKSPDHYGHWRHFRIAEHAAAKYAAGSGPGGFAGETADGGPAD